jgi:endonuclease YncB( thermonuclease family)
MRRILAAILLVVLVCFPATHSSDAVVAQDACGAFDAWEWAQTVYAEDPSLRASLDPDGDGIACESLPRGGFAPALWTDTIPAGAEQATLLGITDGDTFLLRFPDGKEMSARIYRADAPETTGTPQCGGQDATQFAAYVLGYSDTGDQIWIERDVTLTDPYGRQLVYLWLRIDGKPYLLNEVMVRSGYAEDVDYGDRLYAPELGDAARFAKSQNLGVWGLCGGFNVPLAENPGGQESGSSGNAGTVGTNSQSTREPVAEPTYDLTQNSGPQVDAPVYSQPANSGCDPNYTPCVPNVSHDLDCKDIGFSVQVIGYDHHNFDGDGDGWGCESY